MNAYQWHIESLETEVTRLNGRFDELSLQLENYVLERDVAEYERLQQAIKLFLELGPVIISSEGFQNLWRRCEEIKNRYGGLVPKLSPASEPRYVALADKENPGRPSQ